MYAVTMRCATQFLLQYRDMPDQYCGPLYVACLYFWTNINLHVVSLTKEGSVVVLYYVRLFGMIRYILLNDWTCRLTWSEDSVDDVKQLGIIWSMIGSIHWPLRNNSQW